MVRDKLLLMKLAQVKKIRVTEKKVEPRAFTYKDQQILINKVYAKNKKEEHSKIMDNQYKNPFHNKIKPMTSPQFSLNQDLK